VVCHLSDRTEPEPELYPRHFGVTFRNRADFDALIKLVQLRKLPVFRDAATRFEGLAEEHATFVLRDPSNNLIEFKHYLDPRMMY
jgi:extradiol dioxygenase family protein